MHTIHVGHAAHAGHAGHAAVAAITASILQGIDEALVKGFQRIQLSVSSRLCEIDLWHRDALVGAHGGAHHLCLDGIVEAQIIRITDCDHCTLTELRLLALNGPAVDEQSCLRFRH